MVAAFRSRKQGRMNVRTQVKEGLKLKSGLKAGKIAINHNEAMRWAARRVCDRLPDCRLQARRFQLVAR